MRPLAQWIIWWLVSTIGTAVGVLLGFIVSVVVYPLVSFVSFFLILVGGLGFITIGLAGGAGGAVAGTVIVSMQDYFWAGKVQHSEQWVKIGKLGWVLAGLCAAGAVVPIKRGDLSSLVWLTALGASMTGVMQWISLRGDLPQAGWRVLISTIGTLSGSLAGVALLGAITSRGALDPLQRALTFREFVYEASATGMTNLNNNLVFFVSTEDAYQNRWWELWTSDGTPEGTAPVRRAYTGWNEPFITLGTRFNERLFFEANGVLDRADAQSWKNYGGEWLTDGTSAGTILLPSPFANPIALAGNLYFRLAPEGGPCTMYQLTGNEARPVSPLSGVCEGEMVSSESTLFFLTRGARGEPPLCTLWRSDGTAAGTFAIKMFEQDLRHDCPSNLLAVNGRLFMIVPTAAEWELWISDGTQAGTHPVKKLDGVTEPLSTSSPIQANGIYFIGVADKTDTCALWRSDGTSEGTFRLKPLCTLKLTRLDKLLIFVERRDQGGWELWRSDGTGEGTAVVSGFFSSSGNLAPKLIEEINGDLFWAMGDRETCSLWKSRGIQAGLTMVAQLCPITWANLNGMLFFITQKNEYTIELWRSDSTSSGTTLIRAMP